MSGKAEFRKDLVSGDWILVAGQKRGQRSVFTKIKSENKTDEGVSGCPFEDPQKNNKNPFPLLWYPHPETIPSEIEEFSSWFVQVIPNKYPLLFHGKKCPEITKIGSRSRLDAVGHHEVIITRDHFKTIGEMTIDEVQLILKTYKERYRTLSKDPCVKYILIFHNQGEKAGASLSHPHSQLIALPIVDPDVTKSLNGSWNFHKTYKKCVHCVMVDETIKEKERIVNKNKHFITMVPFAPRVSYETRIYPLEHSSRFEDLDKEMFPYLAEALQDSISRLNKVLKNPDYNFFIHTAPVEKNGTEHYHWHIEILPRGFKWAGLELGGGVEVVAVSPEDAAKDLRKAK